MKKLFIFMIAVLLTASVFAQSPQKMSYQAVIRNASNQLVTNQTVGMRISILQGSASGTVVYTEAQTPTTNANGLVSIEIGGGEGFNAIDWSAGPYFIKTETDPTGGVSYTITGTSQLLSVPYALHSKTAESLIGGLQGTTVIQNDSLVLKDAQGKIRMVLNPNTGTFKMMDNDTVWYQVSVNSPKMDYMALGNNQYLITKEENGAKVMELYQGANLIMKQTETREYDMSFQSNKNITVKEEFGYNPSTGTYQKMRETKDEHTDFLNLKDYTHYTSNKIFSNGQVKEENTTIKKYVEGGVNPEHTETNYTFTFDSKGDTLLNNKTVKNFLNNSTKKYIKDFGSYCLIEENYDPLAVQETRTVKDANGNGTSTFLSSNKMQISNSNGNSQRFEYSYNTNTNTTNLNYVKYNGQQSNIASIDDMGSIYLGNQKAIKTNNQGETFLTKNVYITGKSYLYNAIESTSDATFDDVDANYVTVANSIYGKNADLIGNLNVQGTKNFRITHPTDSTKYLVHAAIESNEVLNIYSGNVVSDSQGFATVVLPAYFNEINTDFRYVLTVVGKTFANAIIYQEVSINNQFVIKTSEPNIKVSWQITAKRNDVYLRNHPFIDVIDK